METTDLEGFVCIAKDVKLSNTDLSQQYNCLILESDAQPEYYARNHFPPSAAKSRERHLYLVVKNPNLCFQDTVNRESFKLMERAQVILRIYPGQLVFHQKHYQCIRLDILDVSLIGSVIETFKETGIEFVRNEKIADYTSHVTIKKYVELKSLEEGVFVDKANSASFFFRAPRLVEFEEFLAGMSQIKLSCQYHLFDPFLSYLFYRDKLIDFIGIYSEHCDPSRFGELKAEIKKRFSD